MISQAFHVIILCEPNIEVSFNYDKGGVTMLYILLYVAFAIFAVLEYKTNARKKSMNNWLYVGRNIVNLILIVLFIVNLISMIFTKDRVTFRQVFDNVAGLVIWGAIFFATR